MPRLSVFDRTIRKLASRVADEVLEHVGAALAPTIAREVDRVAATLSGTAKAEADASAQATRQQIAAASATLKEVAAAVEAGPRVASEMMSEALRRQIAPVSQALGQQEQVVAAALRAHPLLRHHYESFDLLAYASIAAALESADYYVAHMLTARAFPTDLDLLRHAAGIAPQNGLVLEFGVASGRTLTCLAEARGGPVYGFDSFDGLPEDWRTGFPRGTFAGAAPQVPDNAELVQGLFAQTLPAFLAAHEGPVALVHVDCDLYASTRDIFAALGERLGPGSVIVFDEYFNYPGWKVNEFKAFREFTTERAIAYRYEGFVPTHQQVCVVLS